ncbi:M13-type metalloendopeptidase [Lysobacter sp. Root494]|uniref:M13 family metallopeptidase n=1 Tax=Lysobacter sp. Root494 TaxID=1736549 RepID=UPI0006FA8F78|nr:M13-type metalloendopeptidase [Lysobacter sp. Root494]KQY52636.1 peptidase [Lysobacter sp. Root494]
MSVPSIKPLAAGWILGVLALTACDAGKPTASQAQASTGAMAFRLDESKLPQVAGFKASDLDANTGACSDLDAYVNGKWKAANPIPSDRTDWGLYEMMSERSLAVQHQLAAHAGSMEGSGVEKIIGDLWVTGMDAAKRDAQGIQPLQSRLDTIAALDDGESIAEFLRQSHAKGEGFVFSFGPSPDFRDSNVNIAYVVQDGLGLPDRSYYFDADKKDARDAYQAHIAKVLEMSGTPAADAAAQAKDVMAFETRLAKVSKSSEELSRDTALYYNPVSVADADKLAPHFPWSRFFASQGLEAPKMFSLAMPAFQREFDRMLADVPAPTWKSYLRFHTVDSAAPFLSDAFARQYFEFHDKALNGQKKMKEPWKRVLGTIDGQAGEAMGQLYVKAAFPADSKAKVLEMVQNMREVLKARLEKLEWMGDATRQKALAKWATFTPKIGYPDTWRDWSGLRTNRDSYIGNVLAANEFNYKWNLGKIGKPVDRSEWGMSPQTVNAYYNPQLNEVVFPAAILQPPLFDPKADDALNYGNTGATIGHELMHGYDDQGSRFGPGGNFENWWTDADAKGFTARSEKLVRQFDAYEALPGMKVNGRLTLGENIADLGGIEVAYDAMKKAAGNTPDPMVEGMSRDQRFFASYALSWRSTMTPESLKVLVASNPHAPANFRAIAPPANMPEFAAAFQCKEGDAMVRSGDKRVVIW